MAKSMVQDAIRQAEARVMTEASLGAKWRDWRTPLGARKAPGPPGVPALGVLRVAVGIAGYGTDPQDVVKGLAIRSAALQGRLASEVQRTIEGLARALETLPEPQRTINLTYLHQVADATIAAGRACQQLRIGRSPAKHDTRLSVAWVVTVGCGLVPQLDRRVKDVAIQAYPLFSAGKRLNESLDPAQAIHVAYVALDVA